VGRHSGVRRRGSRRVWLAAWESAPCGPAFQASLQDALPLKCPVQGLKSLANLSRPSGTKAPPIRRPLTKWQWGKPWAKFLWPFRP